MSNRLRIKSLLSIGAVPEGDNPEAEILFWKSKQSEPDQGPRQETKEDSVPELDIESLDDATKAYISELETKLASLTEEDSDTLPADLPEVVAKRLDDQAATIAKLKEDAERVADERATEKYTAMAKDVETIMGPVDEVAPLLKTIGQAVPEATDELFAKIANIKAIAGFDALLKEHGDSSVEGSAQDQIAAYAAEIRKSNPDLTLAQARAQAWTEHPDLVKQSREEGVI